MTAPKLRFGLLVAILVVLALPAAASAAPVLVHDATTITESAPRDGVITGGDAITIVERIRNTGGAPLTNVTATLTSSTSGVTVDSADSTYPDVAGFGTATNTVAFQVHLPSVLPCGTVVQFSLAVSATDAGSGDPVAEDVAFGVRTGYLGSPTTGYDRGRSTDIPNGTASLRSFSGLAALGGPGTGTSTITVPSADTGTVAGVSVRLGHLHYPLGHLRISLRAPNGRQIVLLDHRGGSATDLDNTTFAVGGADPATVSDFTGATVRPEESFDALLGSARNGNWKLLFAVDDSTELGTLADWHLDLTPADCAPRAFASLTASPSQVAPGGDIVLDASGTVVDGPATYAYSADSAPISGSASVIHTSFAARGLHHITVDVTDVHGAHFSANADVIVSNLPTADLQPGSATVLTGDPVAFDASGSSDVDPGGIVSYEWSIDGGAFQSGGDTNSISFATPGTHGVTVRVTDADGATDEASAVVTANNRPPIAALAVASPPAVTGRTTTLDAGGSTDDGTIVDYQWDLDGDGTFEVDGGTSKTRTVVFGTHGAHVVGVRAVDDYGDHGDAQLTVDVTDPPVAGTIDATPTQPRPGATVTLTVNGASDPDGSIDHYQWDFGDGTSATTAGPSTTHAWAIAATRTITVRVFDDDGANTATSRSLAIGGIPPVATLTATPNPVVEGGSVHFDASGSHDADSPIAGYRWDLDDDGSFERNTGTTPTVDATYPVAGTLTVRVRVTDVDGNTNVASVALSITAPPGGSAPSGESSAGGQAAGGAGAGSGGDAGSGGGSAGGGASGGGRGFTAVLAGDPIQRQDKVLKSGLQVSCRTNRAATCALRVELSGRDARRLGLSRNSRKPFVIARATVRTDGSKPGVAKLRMARVAAAKLRRMARVTVKVTGQATTMSGEKATLTRSVLVRRR